jgi:hypothetical protein
MDIHYLDVFYIISPKNQTEFIKNDINNIILNFNNKNKYSFINIKFNFINEEVY